MQMLMPTHASAKRINLNGVWVGDGEPPYVIAEMSGNHNGSIEKAKQIMQAAALNGADAIKLQTYTPDTMTIRSDKVDFKIEQGLWKGYTLWDLYQWAHTPFEWHAPLFAYAKTLGITCISTPFDETAVDLLESLQCPFYKIASFELLDTALIEYVAKTGKPMIMSTGMASLSEIQQAVRVARGAGARELIVLHCISGYPTPVEQANLKTMVALQQQFNTLVGLSDHTMGNAAAITSIALGACLIEKHFTLDRAEGGPDAEFSMQPEELASLCRDVRAGWQALGTVDFTCQPAEKTNLNFRRSLYAIADIKAGERFTPENMRRIRPGFGISPQYYQQVLGQTALTDIEAGTPIQFTHFAASNLQ